jgi:hypothetical protein
MKSFYLGIVFVLFTTNAFASNQFVKIDGGMDSGGGKGVVCFHHSETNNKVISQARAIYDEDLRDIESISMLDFQYALDSFGASDVIGTEPGSTRSTIETRTLQEKLAFAPDLKQKIQTNYWSVYDNVRMRNAPLKGTFDENDMAIYENANCVLTQLAVQQDLGPAQTVVHIDSRLFNHSQHSEASNVALLLHEAIYFILRKNTGTNNSAYTRELVANIFYKYSFSGDDFVQKFIDSGILVGAPNFKTDGVGVSVDDILNANHYLLPNNMIVKYALSLPGKFSANFIKKGFVSELNDSGWTQMAADALGQKDYPSEMFKKMRVAVAQHPDLQPLLQQYLLTYNNFMSRLNADLENDFVEIRKTYHDSKLGDKNEENLELMLQDLKKLVNSYSMLYIQDSWEIDNWNKKLPELKQTMIGVFGIELYSKFEALSPFLMKPISREAQIPETHPWTFAFPSKMNSSQGSEYNNTQFLLHLFQGLTGDTSFQEHFFSNVTIPKV